ncbi:MAG: outer membrane protein transport protein [Gammaproteobacteria bacterium]
MDKKDFGIFKSLYCTALFSSTFICATSVLAAGFQIQEQSVTNLGTAYSGTAALSADASTNFYNAAGLTHIPHTQIVVSAVGINGKFDLHPTLANANAPANTPISPLTVEDAGGFNFVPGLHMAHRFSDDIVVGMSVTSAFGLKTEYSETSVARFAATRSELITILLSPSIAYQMNPHWSFAVGPDIQYAKANLDVATNFTGGDLVNDGYSKNEGDDWGYSFHAGILYEWTEKTRLGLSYRSHFNYDVEGTNEAKAVPLLGGLVSTRPLETSIVLPETAILSGFHEFENNWAVMFDVHWTAWSRFRTLRLRYPAGSGGVDTDTWEHWKDTIRYAVGAQYRWCDKWIFRAGLALDETPVPEERRTARIPDSDRTWVGVGVGYTFTPNFHVDLGYAHLFFKDANINDRGPFAKQTSTPVLPGTHLVGKYESYANIFGIQVKIDFV